VILVDDCRRYNPDIAFVGIKHYDHFNVEIRDCFGCKIYVKDCNFELFEGAKSSCELRVRNSMIGTLNFFNLHHIIEIGPNVRVNNCLNLSTQDGNINIEKCNFHDDLIKLSSQKGKIELNGNNGGELKITNVDGSIEVKNHTSKYQILCDTLYGEVNLYYCKTTDVIMVDGIDTAVNVIGCETESDNSFIINTTLGSLTGSGKQEPKFKTFEGLNCFKKLKD